MNEITKKEQLLEIRSGAYVALIQAKAHYAAIAAMDLPATQESARFLESANQQLDELIAKIDQLIKELNEELGK